MGKLDKIEDAPLLGDAQPPQSFSQRLRSTLTPDIFSSRPSNSRVGPTTWLDGLRGWAALCVVVMHLTVYTHEGLELCYGSKFRHNEDHNVSPIALPIIRLPFTGGHFSVMLFFTISGYVVPRRLLQMLQEGRSSRAEFHESLQSAMIRRPVRLFLPVFMSTFVVFIIWHVFGIYPPFPKRQSNILFEIWNWWIESSTFSYFFRLGWLYTSYNVHSWTIPVEFRGSMFLFVWLLVSNLISTQARVVLTLLMTLHLSIGSPGAWYACFFSGMFLSELELITLNGSKIRFPWDTFGEWLRRSRLRTVLLHLLLVCSLYLATQPSADWWTKEETLGSCYGWQTLSKLIPYHYVDKDSQFRWFWLFWAAWMMVYAVREIKWLRSCFETSFARYLGKHSFSLYLIHGPMIAIFSEKFFYMTGVKKAWSDEQKTLYGPWWQNRLLDQPWWPLPDGGPFYGLEPNFLFCVALSLPVFLYVAEIGTRVFDEPSVRASRWIWQKWKSL